MNLQILSLVPSTSNFYFCFLLMKDTDYHASRIGLSRLLMFKVSNHIYTKIELSQLIPMNQISYLLPNFIKNLKHARKNKAETWHFFATEVESTSFSHFKIFVVVTNLSQCIEKYFSQREPFPF